MTLRQLRDRAWKLFVDETPVAIVGQAVAVFSAIAVLMYAANKVTESYAILLTIVSTTGSAWLYMDLRIRLVHKHRADMRQAAQDDLGERIREAQERVRVRRQQAEPRNVRLRRKLKSIIRRSDNPNEVEIARARLQDLDRENS